MAILFVAAEAAELKPFANHLTGLRKLSWPIDYAFEGISEGRRILLAANGAGPKLAARALEVAIRAVAAADLSSSRLESVISTGFCGALDRALHACQIVIATQVLDIVSSERYDCARLADIGGALPGVIVSQDRVAGSTTEKLRLFEQTGALAVEMEASGIAERAKRAGLPFSCIKVISDTADESFAFDVNSMRTAEGRIARGKIVLHAFTRPTVVPGLFRLKRRTDQAARILGEFLVSCRISSDVSTLSAE